MADNEIQPDLEDLEVEAVEDYSWEDALRDVENGNVGTLQDLIDMGLDADAAQEFEHNLDDYLDNWTRQSLEFLRQEEGD